MDHWRPVVGSSAYEVSDTGKVRSLVKLARDEAGRWHARPRSRPMILSTKGRVAGYQVVNLRLDGRRRVCYIHSLVLGAFRGERPLASPVSRHLDGNKSNNHISNLVWGSHQENSRDTKTHGHRNDARGSRHPRHKLNETCIREARRLRRNGMSVLGLAKIYGVDDSTMSLALRGLTWRHVTDPESDFPLCPKEEVNDEDGGPAHQDTEGLGESRTE